MSLPASTIDQLAELNDPTKREIRGWVREVERLTEALEKQKETIATLELANATLRRRVESLEGV